MAMNGEARVLINRKNIILNQKKKKMRMNSI